MFEATDYNDFFRAMNDAEVALTGVLGHDLSEDDEDSIGDALNRMAEAKRLVSAVQARHDGDQ